ncbi:MAG TPA: TetR/AcrR family transcriptional regulator [Gemmatimonadales bacterium]|nr:TetR/AcrR family transcriptional regulator [Gemmatimonadales bacterium]
MTVIELTRRERKKEETKERIFNAAMKLFKARGFEETTIEEITEKADVAKGTFFNYFPRKEEVLRYLSEQWLEEVEDKLAAEFKGDAPPNGDRLIEAFVDVARFYEQDRNLARFILSTWMESIYDEEDPTCQRWQALGAFVVGEMQRIGYFRADADPARITNVLQSLYAFTIAKWLHTEPAPYELRQEIRTRFRLVIEGLKGRGNS